MPHDRGAAAPVSLLAGLSLWAVTACAGPDGPAAPDGDGPADPVTATTPPAGDPDGQPDADDIATAVPDESDDIAATGDDTTEDSGDQDEDAAAEDGPAEGLAGGPTASCLAAAEQLSLEDRVGQLFMVAKDSRGPVDEGYRALLEQTRPGSILLLGQSHEGVEAVARLTQQVQEAAPTPEGVGLLVAADQEGGQVQRLQGPGFDRIPPAVEQARMDDDELRAAAARWGQQLQAAGVNTTLAPVVDVVPVEWTPRNAPIGQLRRHYGPSAEEVDVKAAAFVEGMDEAGVATSLKHFPGLGRVSGNTDHVAGVVDTETGPDHPEVQAFAGEAARGADMVMVGTAVYDLIDPGVPAAFSEVVIEDLLRGELGYDGVVIADDLGVAAQVAHLPPGERAVRFLAAGGDIVINADLTVQGQMVHAVRELVGTDPAFADDVDIKVARVLTLKERRGLADCG